MLSARVARISQQPMEVQHGTLSSKYGNESGKSAVAIPILFRSAAEYIFTGAAHHHARAACVNVRSRTDGERAGAANDQLSGRAHEWRHGRGWAAPYHGIALRFGGRRHAAL